MPITYDDKDNTLATSNPRRLVRAVDMNEIKDVVNVIEDDLDTHEALTNNPHSVTKSQVGLGNADNTSDASKPVSTAQQTALDLKANTSSFVYGETPTGTINGSNMAFTLANAATQNTVIASADGVPLRPVEDFTVSGTTLTMTWAPEDYLFIHSYRK